MSADPEVAFSIAAGAAFLAGGGEMGALTRALDWSKTPVGPIGSWPQSLRTAISILLSSRYPMFLFWGPEAVCFYNDGYRPSLGAHKHPQALGQLGRECWVDIWHIIGPQIESVMTQADVTWHEDQLVPFDRNGYFEEIYFTYSYSPVRDESGSVGGTLVVCTETTERVIGERRLKTLRDLATRASGVRASHNAILTAGRTLTANSADTAFALVYEVDTNERMAKLVFSEGLEAGTISAPVSVSLQHSQGALWPLGEVFETGTLKVISGLDLLPQALPGGCWPERTRQAVILPLTLPGCAQPDLLLVAGVSPRKVLDGQYKTFFELAASQMVSAITDARAFEVERHRAESLAELDRAKTEFFTNISHEFRTPLTLMLSPMEDALADRVEPLGPNQRERLDVAHRNGLRVLKLVNTLLDFARIEAGRFNASYEATDLAEFTAELASVFRSAIESAGLELRIDCPPLGEPVYVDRAMWEKIVLNLLSNAFKYTFEGTISVALHASGSHVRLAVSDTGTGIPASELPRLFERFHRVEGARGRTHEGTGIGLALVQQVAQLHGGSVEVESVAGQGSTFSVVIPTGKNHLPADHVDAGRALELTPIRRRSYLHEGEWTLSEQYLLNAGSDVLDGDQSFKQAQAQPESAEGVTRERVLFADDNADIRNYVRRLLATRYEITVVRNGREALDSALANPPDIVLSDIMMPELDGFALLRELRSNPRTRSIPVILLSARAGEEASVEGMDAGADDYLSKPFTSLELLSRVAAHLNLERERRRAEERIMQVFEQAPVAIAVLRGGDLVYELANPQYRELLNQRPIVGRKLIEVIPELDPHLVGLVREVYKTGVPFVASELQVPLDRDGDGAPEDYWFNLVCHALRERDGDFSGVIVAAHEVTSQVLARAELEKMNHELEEFAYVASHDLQEPLRAVNIYTELLLKRHINSDDGQARKYGEWISGGVRRMEKLILDLLEYSRSIQMEMQAAPIADVSNCIASALGVLKDRITDSGASVDSDVQAIVRADEAQLTQVFQNLIGNALKYRKPGEAPRVRIHSRREGGNWIIAVQDNGIGIDSLYKEKIFGLFKRLHGDAYPGTGLGLAICKRIVERFGGRIWVESNKDAGATFYVSLRAVD